MNKRVLIAVLAIGAMLLLGSGIVSAQAPAKEQIEKVTFIHYRDDNGNVKEKVVISDAKVSSARGKGQKPPSTPIPTVTVTPVATKAAESVPNVTPTQTPAVTVEPTPNGTVEPTPTETVNPTPTVTVAPTPTETVAPTPTVTVDPTPAPTESSLYKVKTYKWTQFPVSYYVKPDIAGLNRADVIQQVIAGFDAWDNAVPVGLCEYTGTTDSVMGMNGRTEIQWADFGDTRIIGQTSVYLSAGKILEADIKLNTRMGWGIDADGEGTQYALTGLFDVRNIVTHESGHVFGLADLYDTSAADLTMYGYAGAGEVKRTSLGYGDILGIQALYGT
jgi:hypothetical protein